MLNNNETIESLLPAIRATVARVMGEKNESMIDDLVNDTVVRLLSGSLERCNGSASVKSWVTICARNVCLDYVRTSYAKRGHDSINPTDYCADEGEAANGITLDGTGEDDAERACEANKLKAAMSKLLSAPEQAFVAALADGESFVKASITANTGWSRATAHRRQREIRELLSA